jgi:hippurate hydrolase
VAVDVDRMIEFRHRLHADPEVGLDLPRTQQQLLDAIDGLDLEISTGTGCSSVTAVLRGGAVPAGSTDRPTVLLRADMDAIPVAEETGLPWASDNGAMHACGHDLHMAMLTGALWELAGRRDQLAGDIVVMFQPGEEGCDGAGVMIAEGILDAAGRRPDAAMGLHVWSARPHNQLSVRPGPMMASFDTLHATFRGMDGHGSTPHLAKDPVPALVESVSALQSGITREFDVFHPVVCTVGSLHAGFRASVIPAEGMFEATIRAFDADTRERFIGFSRRVIEGTAAAHDIAVEVEYEPGYPMLVNDADETAAAMDLITELYGAEALTVMEHPDAGAEDFSRVLQEIPGFYAFLGACPADADPAKAYSNHSAQAVFDDGVLARGAEFEVAWATRRLQAVAGRPSGDDRNRTDRG